MTPPSAWAGLVSPVTGASLVPDGPHALREPDGRRWPVIDGIPFLRTGRDALAALALERLDAGDHRGALAILLADQDDWWTGPAPDPADLVRLAAEADRLTLRDAMGLLGFGRVGDYFAHRWSDPTYLAGLALIEAHRGDTASCFELACGIGHYGREFTRRGASYAGADVVFAKLWLARRWVVGDAARLVCFDAAAPWPTVDGSFDLVLCQDAFYFLEPKPAILARLRGLVASRGWLAVGHIHNREAENYSAGRAVTAADIAVLFPDAIVYDDAELTRALAEARAPVPAAPDGLRGVEAFAVASGPWREPRALEGGYSMPPEGAVLSINPLYGAVQAVSDGDSSSAEAGHRGRALQIRYPSERYAAEYGPLATYPRHFAEPRDDASPRRRDPLPCAGRPAGALVMGEPVRWGIAGFGWVARDFTLPAMLAAGDRLAAVCDPDAVARDHAASLGAAAYPTVDGLAADPSVEAVYVATPNHLHRPMVEVLARAGKAILCEKPLAHTLDDAAALVAAVERGGVLYGTAFDQRHHPAHVAIRDAVRGGRLGAVTAVRIVYACWLGNDWSAGSGRDNWRVDPAKAGGGALMDLAPHGLDLAGFLLDEPLLSVAAMTQCRVQGYAVDDGALLMGSTAGGVLVQLHVAYNHPETLPRRRLEVVGTAGLMVAENTMGQDPGGTLTFTDAATGIAAPVRFDAALSPFLAQVVAFRQALRSGETSAFSGARDLHTMRLLAAAYRSAASHSDAGNHP